MISADVLTSTQRKAKNSSPAFRKSRAQSSKTGVSSSPHSQVPKVIAVWLSPAPTPAGAWLSSAPLTPQSPVETQPPLWPTCPLVGLPTLGRLLLETKETKSQGHTGRCCQASGSMLLVQGTAVGSPGKRKSSLASKTKIV